MRQKHLRSEVAPATEIVGIHQMIQPGTAYGGDAGYQAYRLGKLHEISVWTKKGTNYEIINKAIDHTFTCNDLYKWLTKIYLTRDHVFKLGIGFEYV